MKKLIIHDGDLTFEEKLKASLGKEEDFIVIGEHSKIHGCIGCFGCWVKTPTKCVINDDYNRIPDSYKDCDEMIVISECYYGMYSPFIKNIMDRAIGYVLPFFVKRDGEMHHQLRHEGCMNYQIHYYGEASVKEQETAKKLAERNALNLGGTVNAVKFWKSIDEIKLSI